MRSRQEVKDAKKAKKARRTKRSEKLKNVKKLKGLGIALKKGTPNKKVINPLKGKIFESVLQKNSKGQYVLFPAQDLEVWLEYVSKRIVLDTLQGEPMVLGAVSSHHYPGFFRVGLIGLYWDKKTSIKMIHSSEKLCSKKAFPFLEKFAEEQGTSFTLFKVGKAE